MMFKAPKNWPVAAIAFHSAAAARPAPRPRWPPVRAATLRSSSLTISAAPAGNVAANVRKRSATAAGSATKPNNEIRAARAGKPQAANRTPPLLLLRTVDPQTSARHYARAHPTSRTEVCVTAWTACVDQSAPCGRQSHGQYDCAFGWSAYTVNAERLGVAPSGILERIY